MSQNSNVRCTNCYGCAAACVEHCLTLFRVLLCAFASIPAQLNVIKSELVRQNMLEELVNFNLRRSSSMSASVKLIDRDLINLIYLLVRDSAEGTERFNRLIMDKIELFLSTAGQTYSVHFVKNEIILLSALVQRQDDAYWESRLRMVVHILLRSLNVATVRSSSTTALQHTANNPIVVENLTLPMLRILNHLCKTSTNVNLIVNLAAKSTTTTVIKPATMARRYLSEPVDVNEVNLDHFLHSRTSYYDKWLAPKLDDLQLSQIKLKYFSAWRKYTVKKRKQQQLQQQQQQQPSSGKPTPPAVVPSNSPSPTGNGEPLFDYDLKLKWLKYCLFCPCSKSVRQLTANLVQNIFNFYSAGASTNGANQQPPQLQQQTSQQQPQIDDSIENWKKFALVESLIGFLDECTNSGECFNEYLNLLKVSS